MTASVLVALCFWGVSAQEERPRAIPLQAQAERTLPDPETAQISFPLPGDGIIGMSVPCGHEQPTFVTTLMGTDKAGYSLGESVHYDVRISNLCDRAVPIPWLAADEVRGELKKPDFLVRISLSLEDDARMVAATGNTYLIGYDDVPKSYLWLGPRQHVLLHAIAHLGSNRKLADRTAKSEPRTFKAGASVLQTRVGNRGSGMWNAYNWTTAWEHGSKELRIGE